MTQFLGAKDISIESYPKNHRLDPPTKGFDSVFCRVLGSPIHKFWYPMSLGEKTYSYHCGPPKASYKWMKYLKYLIRGGPKKSLSFWGPVYFQGLLLLVSGRVSKLHFSPGNKKHREDSTSNVIIWDSPLKKWPSQGRNLNLRYLKFLQGGPRHQI